MLQIIEKTICCISIKKVEWRVVRVSILERKVETRYRKLRPLIVLHCHLSCCFSVTNEVRNWREYLGTKLVWPIIVSFDYLFFTLEWLRTWDIWVCTHFALNSQYFCLILNLSHNRCVARLTFLFKILSEMSWFILSSSEFPSVLTIDHLWLVVRFSKNWTPSFWVKILHIPKSLRDIWI